MAGLDDMYSHPLCRTHFDQYQLHWGDREMGTAILCKEGGLVYVLIKCI